MIIFKSEFVPKLKVSAGSATDMGMMLAGQSLEL